LEFAFKSGHYSMMCHRVYLQNLQDQEQCIVVHSALGPRQKCTQAR